jgi:hypothetical protein
VVLGAQRRTAGAAGKGHAKIAAIRAGRQSPLRPAWKVEELDGERRREARAAPAAQRILKSPAPPETVRRLRQLQQAVEWARAHPIEHYRAMQARLLAEPSHEIDRRSDAEKIADAIRTWPGRPTAKDIVRWCSDRHIKPPTNPWRPIRNVWSPTDRTDSD